MNLFRYIKYYLKENLLLKKYYKIKFDNEIRRIDDVLLTLMDVILEIKNQSFKQDFHEEHKKRIKQEVEYNFKINDLNEQILNLKNNQKGEDKNEKNKKS